MKKVILELTIEQADALKIAAELYMRIGIGQFEHIADLMDANKIVARPPSALDCEMIDHCREQLKHLSIDSCCSNFGIGNAALDKSVQRSYEIYKTLNAVLQSELLTISPSLIWRPCDGEPMPIAEVVEK